MLKPCKHLDYTEGRYGPDIELRTMAPEFPTVRYWHRGPRWTDSDNAMPGSAKVQFCGKGRGRINEVFACYTGEMSCYDSAPDVVMDSENEDE